MNDEILTVNLRDASRLTGLSSTTLRRMCVENRLRHARLQNGGSQRSTYLIFRDALDQLIRPYEPTLDARTRGQKVGRPQKVQL